MKEGGEPSHMLRDRLQRGVEVHRYGASEKLLMAATMEEQIITK